MKAAVILPIPPVLQDQFHKAQAWRRNEYILPDVAERYQYNDSGISQDISKLLEHSGLETKEVASETRRQTYTDAKGDKSSARSGVILFTPSGILFVLLPRIPEKTCHS